MSDKKEEKKEKVSNDFLEKIFNSYSGRPSSANITVINEKGKKKYSRSLFAGHG